MWRVTAARKAPASLSPTVAYRPLQCFKGALAQATEFSGNPGWTDTRIKQRDRQARRHDADAGQFQRDARFWVQDADHVGGRGERASSIRSASSDRYTLRMTAT